MTAVTAVTAMASMASRKPDPSLQPRQLLPLLLGLSLAVAPHLLHMPWWIGAWVALSCLGYGVLLLQRRPLPPRALLLLLAALGSTGIWLTHHSLFGRDAGVSLLALLMTLKLLELRQLRDAWVLVLLAYFLALTNFFYSQSLPTAALMLLTVLVISASLIGLQPGQRRFTSELRTAALLLLQAVPLVLLLFLLFPRLPGPLWGLPQDAFSGVTGLSDSMSPGAISRLSRSDAIAFRVQFDTGQNVAGSADGLPAPAQRYWRGPVFSDFDGRTWRAVPSAAQTPERTSTPPSTTPLTTPPTSPPAPRYVITLEPHQQYWLFALDAPLHPPEGASLRNDYQLLWSQPVHSRLRYVMDAPPPQQPPLLAGASSMELRMASSLPSAIARLNPQARALAAQWRADHADDAALVQAALALLRQGNYRYTLEPPLLGEHSVDEFLFATRQGFCEHFASSFAFLMRAAGIPARIVTGYQGGERNPVDGTLVLRQADAHAWTEVWLGQRGWVRIDPTAIAAPLRIDEGIVAAVPEPAALPLLMRPAWSWTSTVRHRWDAINNQWNQRVIAFSAEQQQALLGRLGLAGGHWRELALLLFWSVAAVLALIALSLLGVLDALRPSRLWHTAKAHWPRWMLRHTSWQSHHTQQALQRGWQGFLRRLAAQQLHIAASEGAASFGQRAALALPQHAAAIDRIVQGYLQLRYGAPAEPILQRQQLQAWQVQLRQFLAGRNVTTPAATRTAR